MSDETTDNDALWRIERDRAQRERETINKAALRRIEINRARRERIAMSCLRGLLSYTGNSVTPMLAASISVAYADALIFELDKE